ncbi:hypothetical protein GGI12_000029 [Dipsacomyces acuminosporus]|nr:hypothetical protein GGI12_000029 [Dipsacomyces acuminosporus]
MADNSNAAADDAIYNDDSNNYSYDQYQAESQWLYNDSQVLQMPQAETAVASNAAAGADDSGSKAINKDAGKLFVGGLSWETDESKLRDYFSKYGNIMECSIMRDQMSGRPRGFGFVSFDDPSGVDAVLQEPTHTLDGKVIDPKHAIPREQQSAQSGGNAGSGSNMMMNSAYAGGNMAAGQGASELPSDPIADMKGDKVFVGGLPPSATDADMNSGFAMFGNIIETKLMIDRETGRSRGYGFLQFDSDTAALEAVKAGNTGDGISIHGKRVDVKPAVHKKRTNAMPNMGMMGMPGYNMMGMGAGYNMMGMPGYNMMGMQYGMMNMPGYGGMMGGASGQSNGPMDYSNIAYAGYYNNMAGYYGAQGDGAAGTGADGSGDADGANGSSSANNAGGYYGQGFGMGGYYTGAEGQADGSSNINNAAGVQQLQNASDKSAYNSGTNSSYQQQSGGGANGSSNNGSGNHGKSSRSGDDKHGRDSSHRDRDRDSGHRSSSRRHGGSSGRDHGGGSGRERSRGDRSGHGRSNDDYRGQRSSRSGRDRGSGGSSRSHGYNPY